MDYFINLPNSPSNFIPDRGSFLYYCYRKIPRNQQTQIMVIENIQHQLINTCELYREKLVAIKKLEWWIEEIERVFTGSPNHPLLIELVTIKNSYGIDKPIIIKLFENKAKILSGVTINNRNMLKTHISEQYSYFEQIKAKILLENNTDTKTLDWVNQLSQTMEKIRYTYLLAHHKTNQIYLLPDINESTSPNDQLSSLKNMYQQIMNDDKKLFPNSYDKALKPLLNRYKLHIKLLNAMKKNNFNVDKERLELSPLQMLFSTK